RFVKSLDIALENFGTCVLQRRVKISDFIEKELKEIKRGDWQLLPFRDRSGRRILAMVGNIGLGMDPVAKFKWFWYLSMLMTDEIETQQKGFIVIMFAGSGDAGFQLPNSDDDRAAKQIQDASMVRFAVVHGCFPDTPMFRMMQSMCTLVSPNEMRLRLKFHIGRSIETRYQLVSYGIPVATIPITDSGTVKTKFLAQWIKSRRAIEAAESDHSNNKEYIDCPMTTDVVFRNGTAAMSHVGNAKFRELVATHFQDHSRATSAQAKTEISWRIANKVLANGRFLEWDRSVGCWTPMTDRSQIRLKVAVTLRDFKKVAGFTLNQQVSSSATDKFMNPDWRHKKRQKLGETEDAGCLQFCSLGSSTAAG
ncbi:MAG: hypothetical protein SGILL_008936, partial [Bacillariaceae sp.]